MRPLSDDMASVDSAVPSFFETPISSTLEHDDIAADPARPSEASSASQAVHSFRAKYKTELCKNWELTGTCSFEDSCSFAHGAHELNSKPHVPKNYKTKLCKRFHEELYCPYGPRCQFKHSEVAEMFSSGAQTSGGSLGKKAVAGKGQQAKVNQGGIVNNNLMTKEISVKPSDS